MIVWPYYFLMWIWVMWWSASAAHAPMKRWKFWTLGMSMLCFGSGRFLWREGIMVQWLFDLGHLSLIMFGFLYGLSGLMEWEPKR